MTQTAEKVTTKQLEKDLSALTARRESMDAEMKQREGEIKRLVAEQSTAGTTRRALEYRIAEAMNRLFTRTPLAPEFIAKRKTLVRKMMLSRSERITVARQKSLAREIAKDVPLLQSLCKHPFVFSYDGYGGSPSYDYDDKVYGRRVCTLCNLAEESSSATKDLYKTFDEDGTHLVRRDLRDKKDLPGPGEQEWFSLAFLHRLFEASAASGNVNWPSSFDKDSVLKL